MPAKYGKRVYASSSSDELLPLRTKEDGRGRLFASDLVEQRWESAWHDMPAYEMGDTTAHRSVIVHFRSDEEVEEFGRLVDVDMSDRTKVVWFSRDDGDRYSAGRERLWVGRKKLVPRYPIYIPSVGRWESLKTARSLDALGIPYSMVVEPAQYARYRRALGRGAKIFVLPEDYSRHNTGSIPARNWIWKHSVAAGDARHWVIDDNIFGFLRFNRNRRIAVSDGAIFRAAEDFTDRYENIALSGFQYENWTSRAERYGDMPPYYLNTRIYSCILVNNVLSHRWRGRYNEDTDLSLRVLKDGWCTVLFNAFLCQKTQTLSMKGGNTDTIYAADDKRLEFARSLEEQHPDVARVVWRYNRWHHEVDYSRFSRNRLIEKSEYYVSPDPEYGMEIARASRRSVGSQHRESTYGDQEGEAGAGDIPSGAGGREEGAVPTGDSSGDPRGPRRRVQR